MNDGESNLHPWIEPELEARIIALVLGEASDFESEELGRLVEERPELAMFQKRMEAIHRLLHEAATGEMEDGVEGEWKLPKERRNAVLAAIENGSAVEEMADSAEAEVIAIDSGESEGKGTRSRRFLWRQLLNVAAVLCLLGIIASIALPSYNRVISSRPLFAASTDGETRDGWDAMRREEEFVTGGSSDFEDHYIEKVEDEPVSPRWWGGEAELKDPAAVVVVSDGAETETVTDYAAVPANASKSRALTSLSQLNESIAGFPVTPAHEPIDVEFDPAELPPSFGLTSTRETAKPADDELSFPMAKAETDKFYARYREQVDEGREISESEIAGETAVVAGAETNRGLTRRAVIDISGLAETQAEGQEQKQIEDAISPLAAGRTRLAIPQLPSEPQRQLKWRSQPGAVAKAGQDGDGVGLGSGAAISAIDINGSVSVNGNARGGTINVDGGTLSVSPVNTLGGIITDGRGGQEGDLRKERGRVDGEMSFETRNTRNLAIVVDEDFARPDNNGNGVPRKSAPAPTPKPMPAPPKSQPAAAEGIEEGKVGQVSAAAGSGGLIEVSGKANMTLREGKESKVNAAKAPLFDPGDVVVGSISNAEPGNGMRGEQAMPAGEVPGLVTFSGGTESKSLDRRDQTPGDTGLGFDGSTSAGAVRESDREKEVPELGRAPMMGKLFRQDENAESTGGRRGQAQAAEEMEKLAALTDLPAQNLQRYGDFDNGMGDAPDGPYIDKPDEGNVGGMIDSIRDEFGVVDLKDSDGDGLQRGFISKGGDAAAAEKADSESAGRTQGHWAYQAPDTSLESSVSARERNFDGLQTEEAAKNGRGAGVRSEGGKKKKLQVNPRVESLASSLAEVSDSFGVGGGGAGGAGLAPSGGPAPADNASRLHRNIVPTPAGKSSEAEPSNKGREMEFAFDAKSNDNNLAFERDGKAESEAGGGGGGGGGFSGGPPRVFGAGGTIGNQLDPVNPGDWSFAQSGAKAPTDRPVVVTNSLSPELEGDQETKPKKGHGQVTPIRIDSVQPERTTAGNAPAPAPDPAAIGAELSAGYDSAYTFKKPRAVRVYPSGSVNVADTIPSVDGNVGGMVTIDAASPVALNDPKSERTDLRESLDLYNESRSKKRLADQEPAQPENAKNSGDDVLALQELHEMNKEQSIPVEITGGSLSLGGGRELQKKISIDQKRENNAGTIVGAAEEVKAHETVYALGVNNSGAVRSTGKSGSEGQVVLSETVTGDSLAEIKESLHSTGQVKGITWDTPAAGGVIDQNSGRHQAAQHEWQRYPGHPATTHLVPEVVGGGTAAAKKDAEGESPERFAWFTSSEGTIPPASPTKGALFYDVENEDGVRQWKEGLGENKDRLSESGNTVWMDGFADNQEALGVVNGTRSGANAIDGDSIDALISESQVDDGRQNQPAPATFGVAGVFTDPQFEKAAADYYKQARNNTRAEFLRRVAEGWELPAPDSGVTREFIYPTDYDPPETRNVEVGSRFGNTVVKNDDLLMTTLEEKPSSGKTVHFGFRDAGESFAAQRVVPPAGLEEKNAAEESFSTFSLHVSDVSFKLAQAALAKGEWPEAGKVRIEEFVNALDYGDPNPTQDDKVACRVEQAIHPFLQQRNLMRVAMRTAAAGRAGDTPLRLTFLLDNSGSMERADREETVRRAFALLADQLQPIDQVTLISFARQPRLLADKVSGDQSRDLVEVVANLPSEGGTNLEAALKLAFEKAQEQKIDKAQNRIVLLTDGAANLGNAKPESLAAMIESMREEGIAFDAAGIGADGLNDEILEALTRKGDGRYYLLDRPEDADDGFARQIAGALRPAAKNVKVQVEFNPDRVGNYKLLGFEKHRLKKEDFRDDSVDAAEMAAEEAGVAVYQFEARPDGEGDVGFVSVRFRDMSSGEMVEKRWPIPYEPSAPRPDQAAPSMQLATVAALFAAKLNGEPLGDTVELEELAKTIGSLPASFQNKERVQQLRQMIEQARNLAK